MLKRDFREHWHPSNAGEVYGEVMQKRALGELPEMESAKAVVKLLEAKLKPSDKLVDLGCGVGHYLRSLRAAFDFTVDYTGIDTTPHFIDLARRSFAEDEKAAFFQGDLFNLELEDQSFEIAMCNNVFLHLPTVETPLAEICRVAKRHVIIRTLVGERAFRVQEIHEPETYDENGEPANYNYYNIYGKTYIERLVSIMPRVKSFRITADQDFDVDRIQGEKEIRPDRALVTTVCDGWQVNGYVMAPWCFIEIDLED